MKRLGLFWLLTGLVQGQPAPPPVEIQGGSIFGDIVRYGRPFQAELEVSVSEPGVDYDGGLQIPGEDGEFSTRIPFHLGLGKRTLSAPIVSSRYGPDIKLLGVPSSLKSITSLSPSVASEQDYVALTLSPRKNQFSYLGGYKALIAGNGGEFRLNQPRPGKDLPDLWWTYLGHDAVVVHDLPNLKLSDGVEKALLEWTQAGGSLVLVSNLDPGELTDTAFQGLAPLQASGVEKHGVPMLVGNTVNSRVILRHQGIPLLLRRPYGAGTIWQITAALDSQDVLGSKDTTEVWKAILKEQPGLKLRKEFVFGGSGRLSVLPELPAPATAALAWYLAFYVLVVVPGIYVYLRRKDQVLRLIVVVPACSTLITLGAYYFNSAGRGHELVLRELGLAWVRGGQTELVLDQTGVLFSPAPLKLKLDMDRNTLLRPNSTVRSVAPEHILVSQGQSLQMEAERLPQWGISRWLGFGVRHLDQPVSLNVTPLGKRWQVKIDNRSLLKLEKAVMVFDSNSCSKVFSLSPGPQEMTLELANASGLETTLSDGRLGGALSNQDANQMQREIDSLSQGKPALLAMVDDPLLSVVHPTGLQPKTTRQTLLVVTVDEP